MGLYDGFAYDDDAGSTAAASKLLNAPVVLVVDASKMARSAGAIALGFRRFDPDLNLVGFIANRVGGDSHGRGVGIGYRQRDRLAGFRLAAPRPAARNPRAVPGPCPDARARASGTDFIDAAGEIVAKYLDLDRILTIAREAPPLTSPAALAGAINSTEPLAEFDRPVIAVARDEAFHFTYPENLELLEAAGAEVAFFSPLHDDRLPPRTAGVMLSGGFPELYASELSGNGRLRAALREAHDVQMPIYAECGGLMYLTEAIVDDQGARPPDGGVAARSFHNGGPPDAGLPNGPGRARLVAVQGRGDDSGSRVPLFVLGRPTGRPACCP